MSPSPSHRVIYGTTWSRQTEAFRLSVYLSASSLVTASHLYFMQLSSSSCADGAKPTGNERRIDYYYSVVVVRATTTVRVAGAAFMSGLIYVIWLAYRRFAISTEPTVM